MAVGLAVLGGAEEGAAGARGLPALREDLRLVEGGVLVRVPRGSSQPIKLPAATDPSPPPDSTPSPS